MSSLSAYNARARYESNKQPLAMLDLLKTANLAALPLPEPKQHIEAQLVKDIPRQYRNRNGK